MHSRFDRLVLDAADRHLAHDCRCAFCEDRIDADTAPEASAEVAAHLGVAGQALICDGCARDAAEDLAAAGDAALAADPDFVTVCDARRDGWIAALESETAAQWASVVRLGADLLDREVAL